MPANAKSAVTAEFADASDREIKQLRADLERVQAELKQVLADNTELRSVIARQDHRAASAIDSLDEVSHYDDTGGVRAAIRILKERIAVRKLVEVMRDNATANTG
jgi:hypothetical protein